MRRDNSYIYFAFFIFLVVFMIMSVMAYAGNERKECD